MALLSSPPRPRSRLLVGVIAMVAVALALVAAAMQLRRAPSVAPAPVEIDSGRRRVIAVLPPKNISAADADAAWLPIAVGQMVSAELTASPQLRSVEPDQLAQTEADLSLGNLAELSPGQLDALKKSLDLDLVLSGALTVVGKRDDRTLRLDLRLYDARARSAAGRGDRVGGRERSLRDGAPGEREISREPSPAVGERSRFGCRACLVARVARGRNAPTPRAFARCTPSTWCGRDRSCRRPSQPSPASLRHMPHTRRRCWHSVGAKKRYRSPNMPSSCRARCPVSRSSPSRRSTPPPAKTGRGRSSCNRSLSTVFPDDFEHGLHLATAQLGGGRLTDGLATLEQLRHRPGPEHDDPRIELAASWLQVRVPDFVAAEKSAAIAAVQAGVRNARVLQARARLSQAEALLFQSRRDEALPLLDEAVNAVSHRRRSLERGEVEGAPRSHLSRPGPDG